MNNIEAHHNPHKARAKETHPDHNPGKDGEFLEVQLAYEVLKDPLRRKRYDETGSTKHRVNAISEAMKNHATKLDENMAANNLKIEEAEAVIIYLRSYKYEPPPQPEGSFSFSGFKVTME